MPFKTYPDEYNNLLSDAFEEFGANFAALASPTLSKQETVTGLYKTMERARDTGKVSLKFPWKRVAEFPIRLALAFFRIVYAALQFRIQTLPENSVVFKTWLVPRSFRDGLISDNYFHELASTLSNNENVVTMFGSMRYEMLRHYGRSARAETQYVSNGLLTLTDILRLFVDYVFTALLQTRKKYNLNGSDVSGFINNALMLDYLMLRSFEAYTDKYRCRRLIRHGIKAFVYVFENQSWEKVCCKILRDHGVRVIGYQSSGFSPVFLNFFPTKKDSRRQPMPDVLLTVGDYFKSYLQENGCYRIPIETFAALRFPYPTSNGRYLVLQPNRQVLRRIIYAFPVHIEQYAGTIESLVSIFGDGLIEVDLKLHPLYQVKDIKGLNELPDNFRVVTNIQINKLRDTYDCVLFNDNSYGIEALLSGVKSFQYDPSGCFFDDRFMYFSLWPVNYGREDLLRLRKEIESGTFDKQFNTDEVESYINHMYKPYCNEAFERFRQLLQLPVLVSGQ